MPKLKTRQELRQLFERLADGGIQAPGEFAAERTRVLDVPQGHRRTRPTSTPGVVGQAIDKVRGKYVKDIPAGEWAAMAVKGLYWRLDEPLPDDLAADPQGAQGRSPAAGFGDAAGRCPHPARQAGRHPRPSKDVDKTIDGMMFELYVQHRDPYTTYYDRETIKQGRRPN